MAQKRGLLKTIARRLPCPVVLLCVVVFLAAISSPAQEKGAVLLRMGLVYQASIQDTVLRFQPLFNYLEKHLPIRIEPLWYDSGYQLIMDIRNGTVDLVLADGVMYLYAREKLKASQVAVMRVKGGFTRRAVIVVRKDSGLQRFPELWGKRMALVGPFDALSTLWIQHRLEAQGETLNSFFHSLVNTMSYEASILNTVLKEVDAAAVEEGTFLRARGTNPKIRETLKIIETSPPYSNEVIVASKALDPSFLRKIGAVLATMKNSLEGNAVLASINCDGFFPQGDELFLNDKALMKFFPQVR